MENVQDILDKFQNGDRRYTEDPVFKEVVYSLKAGIGAYAVLDGILRAYAANRSLANGLLEKLKYKPQIVMSTELYPGETLDLRAKNQKLLDEIASYRDALELMQRGL